MMNQIDNDQSINHVKARFKSVQKQSIILFNIISHE